jgi:outer membrane protein OmpU
MKKVLLATTAVVAFAGAAAAQDLTIGGFVAFDAVYGDNYDLGAGRSIDDLDFGVDARLNFDYSASTKSGLGYGAHFELDMYSSDVTKEPADALEGQSDVSFNDGYVFINSALGNVAIGDAGKAGAASNQLNTPYLAPGAIEDSNLGKSELELIKYSNSFLGVDFAASVDDDSNWALGIGYGADVGGVSVSLGLSAGEEALAGSIGASAGGLAFGVNYAHEEVGATTEYVAAGVSYSMGALSIGTGVETEVRHGDLTGEEYETNYFVGATYELADGLVLGVGAANLDSDNCSNWSATFTANATATCGNAANTSNNALLGQGRALLDDEGRAWTAGASVKVSF